MNDRRRYALAVCAHVRQTHLRADEGASEIHVDEFLERFQALRDRGCVAGGEKRRARLAVGRVPSAVDIEGASLTSVLGASFNCTHTPLQHEEWISIRSKRIAWMVNALRLPPTESKWLTSGIIWSGKGSEGRGSFSPVDEHMHLRISQVLQYLPDGR